MKEYLHRKLSDEEIEQLLEQRDIRDEDIDTSDIPEIKELPARVVRGQVARREMVHRRRPDGKLPLPVYLTAEVEDYFSAIASRRGGSLTDLVNDVLSKEMAIMEIVK